jgi:hypothetical protein
MFERLTDLSFQRTKKQAAGFYLASLFAGALLSVVIVITYMHINGIAPHTEERGFQAGFDAGMGALQQAGSGLIHFIVFVMSTTLAFMVVRAKNIYNRVTIGCIFLTVVLSFAAILAFIPIAYLTTLPKSTPPQGS